MQAKCSVGPAVRATPSRLSARTNSAARGTASGHCQGGAREATGTMTLAMRTCSGVTAREMVRGGGPEVGPWRADVRCARATSSSFAPGNAVWNHLAALPLSLLIS